MTFQELFRQEKKRPKPLSPTAAFIKQVRKITCKSETAVRSWIQGTQQPDALTQKTLENYFGISAEELFPPKP